MSHWKPRTLLLRLVLPALLLGGGGVGAALLTLPASASALPESATQCSGWLTPDSSGRAVGEPDLIDYAFFCSTGITAYTIVVDRLPSDGDNVDDFNPSPNVFAAGTDGELSPTESVNCGGEIPSNGINCYSLVGATAGALTPGDEVEGGIDPTSEYCSYLPKGAKAGTPAVPRATVELIVTDNTGAEDGPFELHPTTACPKVPAVVPTKVTKKKTTRRNTTKPAIKKASVAK